jgi:hypothetical protein
VAVPHWRKKERQNRPKKKRGNTPQFGLREALFRMTGVDLTRIDCIDVMTAATVISEAGSDMSKWQSEDHCCACVRTTK